MAWSFCAKGKKMDGFAPCFQVEPALDHGEVARGGDDAGGV
jgi:hypothetical protein